MTSTKMGASGDTGESQLSKVSRWAMGLALLAASAALVWEESTAAIIVAALAASIVIHELGHYIAARLVGVDVSEFFIGLGPKVWSFNRKGTEYGLKALPLGGYVRVAGLADEDELQPDRGYRSKSLPRKLAIVFAGSTFQIVLAFCLLWCWLALSGPLTEIEGFEVTAVIEDGPADQAGIVPGDTILAVDGQKVSSASAMPHLMGRTPGNKQLLIERAGAPSMVVVVTPGDAVLLGINGKGRVEPKPYGTLDAARKAGLFTAEATTLTVDGIADLVRPSTLTQLGQNVASPDDAPTQVLGDGDEQAGNRVTSVVGLIQIGSQAFEDHLIGLIPFMAAVNVLIAFFNLIPVPPLDGGHAVIAVYERIRSRRGSRYVVNPRLVNFASIAFLVVFGAIAFSAMFVDIANPVDVGS